MIMEFINTGKFYTVKTETGVYEENVEIIGYSDGFVMIRKYDGIRFKKILVSRNKIHYITGPFKDPKEQDEAWIIPFCIEEFERLNKKLQDYTPFNSELEKLSIQEVVYRLALEMQIQNNISIMALRVLMGKTEK